MNRRIPNGTYGGARGHDPRGLDAPSYSIAKRIASKAARTVRVPGGRFLFPEPDLGLHLLELHGLAGQFLAAGGRSDVGEHLTY